MDQKKELKADSAVTGEDNWERSPVVVAVAVVVVVVAAAFAVAAVEAALVLDTAAGEDTADQGAPAVAVEPAALQASQKTGVLDSPWSKSFNDWKRGRADEFSEVSKDFAFQI